MNLPTLERKWTERKGFLPPGVSRGWVAEVDGQALSAVFELNAATVLQDQYAQKGRMIEPGSFIVAYHIQGASKAIAERWPTFEQAQQRAVAIMDQYILIPRPL